MAVRQMGTLPSRREIFGDNYDDEITIRIVNISPIAGAKTPRIVFQGPVLKKGRSGDVRIPISTVERPFRELPKVVADWLLQHGAGKANGGALGDLGLRLWRSPTPTPETPEDKALMKLIERSEKVMRGEIDPPVPTDIDIQPYMSRSVREQDLMSANVPDESWSVAELESWRKKNAIGEFPEGLDHKQRVAVARQFANAMAERKGTGLRAPERAPAAAAP